MNSDYKWREPTSTRLNGSNAKNSPWENGEQETASNNFVRKHQRNLSLPVNSVFIPTVIA